MTATKTKAEPWSLETLRGEVITIAAGAAGGFGFYAAHIPGGAMSGSVIAVALLSVFGQAAPIGGVLRVLALSTMGVAIGSAVTPDTFSNLSAYPGSAVMMSVCVVAMTLASAAVWTFFLRWPPTLALLSSVPGSMSYLVAVSLTMGADATRIAVVQMSRIIFLVTVLPFIVVYQSGGHFGSPAIPVVDPIQVLIPTLLAGIAFGFVLTRFGLGGGMLLGSLLLSGVVHFLGWAPGRVPMWMLNWGQVLLGSWVGSRFVDFDWSLFGRIMIGTTAAVGASMAVSVLFAMTAAALFGVSFGTALIAYAPGGQDSMMVLALTLGVDPIFVSAHHLARYFIINLTLPFLISWLRKRDAAAKVTVG